MSSDWLRFVASTIFSGWSNNMDVSISNVISNVHQQDSTGAKQYSPWFPYPIEKMWTFALILEFVAITVNLLGYAVTGSFVYHITISVIIANSIINILFAIYTVIQLKILYKMAAKHYTWMLDDLYTTAEIGREFWAEIFSCRSTPLPRTSNKLPPKFSQTIGQLFFDMRLKIQSRAKGNTADDRNMGPSLTEEQECRSDICFKLKNPDVYTERRLSCYRTFNYGVFYLVLTFLYVSFFLDLPQYRTTFCAIIVIWTLLDFYVLLVLTFHYDDANCFFELRVIVEKMFREVREVINFYGLYHSSQSCLGLTPNRSTRLAFVFWLEVPGKFHYHTEKREIALLETCRVEVSVEDPWSMQKTETEL